MTPRSEAKVPETREPRAGFLPLAKPGNLNCKVAWDASVWAIGDSGRQRLCSGVRAGSISKSAALCCSSHVVGGLDYEGRPALFPPRLCPFKAKPGARALGGSRLYPLKPPKSRLLMRAGAGGCTGGLGGGAEEGEAQTQDSWRPLVGSDRRRTPRATCTAQTQGVWGVRTKHRNCVKAGSGSPRTREPRAAAVWTLMDRRDPLPRSHHCSSLPKAHPSKPGPPTPGRKFQAASTPAPSSFRHPRQSCS